MGISNEISWTEFSAYFWRRYGKVKRVGSALPSYSSRSKDLERTVYSHLHTPSILPVTSHSTRLFYTVHDLVLSAVSDANYNIPVPFVRIWKYMRLPIKIRYPPLTLLAAEHKGTSRRSFMSAYTCVLANIVRNALSLINCFFLIKYFKCCFYTHNIFKIL